MSSPACLTFQFKGILMNAKKDFFKTHVVTGHDFANAYACMYFKFAHMGSLFEVTGIPHGCRDLPTHHRVREKVKYY